MRRWRDTPYNADPRVGSFRFWFEGQRWEWSDEMYRIHGYAPGSVEPTSALVLSHQHPDERDSVEDLLDQARYSGGSFSSRHRLCDTAGRERNLIVVAERMLDATDAVVGASGHYIDLTDVLEQGHRDNLDKTLPKLFEARAVIEQAKGALRLVYGMNEEQAFKLLQWRSQENNTKLRALANRLVAELDSLTEVTSALRTEFDHLIMTVHERVNHRS
ncbi:PAS and ANTAR domain-containing protein [Mycobacterium sp. 29Ha]|nr:PAS and ANTAR domain-containing protein [Mycobacterium sp. 29Ha]MDV3134509.1 PAS and ANTAR domain-containing protein [Mycobacterium sp. 29Ha]